MCYSLFMDIWKHGKYVDMWSLVHFLSGLILFTGFYELGIKLIPSLILSTIMLIAWEVFEWMVNIIEPSINVTMDIVIGLLGFFLGAYLYYFLKIEIDHFWTILLTTILLSFWGFIDFLKRGYR